MFRQECLGEQVRTGCPTSALLTSEPGQSLWWELSRVLQMFSNSVGLYQYMPVALHFQGQRKTSPDIANAPLGDKLYLVENQWVKALMGD